MRWSYSQFSRRQNMIIILTVIFLDLTKANTMVMLTGHIPSSYAGQTLSYCCFVDGKYDGNSNSRIFRSYKSKHDRNSNICIFSSYESKHDRNSNSRIFRSYESKYDGHPNGSYSQSPRRQIRSSSVQWTIISTSCNNHYHLILQ